MSKTYTQASPQIHEQAREIMRKHHMMLEAASPTFLVLFVDAGVDALGIPKPAIKQNGYPCAGMVKLTGTADRACGKPDFVIHLDAPQWQRLDEEGRTSLLDHEITHVEPDLTEEGEYQNHEDNRPKLKMRRHDHEIGIFHDVIARHGAAAVDSLQVMAVYKSDAGQQVFAFYEKMKAKSKKQAKKAA